ncbi:MAG TPA: hypothetical protein VKV17_16075 [Bryobacteraceae bacterium]|nr:hypothetical protein [Bryobacteraceae bacterium]
MKTALDNRMVATAAIGLLDLGNVYSGRGEPRAAERYFQQGLDLASRSRALFSQARGQLSLAALYVQYDRPAEALPYTRPAVNFFRMSGYRREEMQKLLISSGAQETLDSLPARRKRHGKQSHWRNIWAIPRTSGWRICISVRYWTRRGAGRNRLRK